jgi:two-component system sensor histidine kinase VanS
MKVTVFTKVFAYTMLLVLAICLAAVLLFSREFLSFYRADQQRRLSASFEPIISAIEDREASAEEIIKLASEFASKNESFRFRIELQEGDVLFDVGNADNLLKDYPSLVLMLSNSASILSDIKAGSAGNINTYVVTAAEDPNIFTGGTAVRVSGTTVNQDGLAANGYIFTGYSPDSETIDIASLVRGFLAALVLMLAIAVLGAMLFAKKVTKPLEDEIIRERAMEENQRLFFSAASHELKTPIAAARALVEGMIAGVGDYRDTRKYLRECLKTLDSQARLVSDILEIVKLSDNESAGETAAVEMDLSELNNTVLAEYRPLAELAGLLIQGEFPRVSVLADRALLQRVFSNVMANAVQYTPEGGTIRIASNENPVEGKSLRVSILNTGAHISEEVISRIFEPFYRLDTARTRHDTQSGMGLAIVKKALDRMKLPFALENTEEGVLFWVDIEKK